MRKIMVAAFAVFAASPLLAAIKLGCPFTDGVVLQRDMNVPAWGSVSGDDLKDCKVKVEFAGQGKLADIGPDGKEIVAKRLAVHALKRDYGFAIPEDDSPVCKKAELKDGAAVVEFDNVTYWYIYADNYSRNLPFEIAGADGKWHPAVVTNFRKAKNGKPTEFIDGAKLVLKSDKVAEPKKVRYMGKPRTAGTLYNEASLPLGPFESTLR